MDERGWFSASDPLTMLEFLRATDRASARKSRLFACACSRRVWHLLDEFGRGAGEGAEEFADGLARAAALRAARLACKAAGGQAGWYAAASDPFIAARNAALSAQSCLPGEK